MTITYEIRKRDTNEHRSGHNELMINGVFSEYTNDPTQHFEKCLKKCVSQGMSQAEATIQAQKMAEDISAHALMRIADRLRAGSMLPSGLPTGEAKGKLIDDTKFPYSPRQNENVAVEAFLNRGRLNGLDKDARSKRRKERDARRDHVAEWTKRRLALIKSKEDELAAIIKSGDTRPKIERQIAALKDEIAALKAPVRAASHGFQYAFGQYLQAAINFVSDDIRIAPLMTNTTVDTERDAKDQNVDFTTLDEFDGANYSTGGLALDNQAVNIDDANDRAEFDSDDETVTALGAGTRSIQGVLLMKFVTNMNSSVPLHWLEFASNKTPDGSNFTFQFNAEGILQASG